MALLIRTLVHPSFFNEFECTLCVNITNVSRFFVTNCDVTRTWRHGTNWNERDEMRPVSRCAVVCRQINNVGQIFSSSLQRQSFIKVYLDCGCLLLHVAIIWTLMRLDTYYTYYTQENDKSIKFSHERIISDWLHFTALIINKYMARNSQYAWVGEYYDVMALLIGSSW